MAGWSAAWAILFETRGEGSRKSLGEPPESHRGRFLPVSSILLVWLISFPDCGLVGDPSQQFLDYFFTFLGYLGSWRR